MRYSRFVCSQVLSLTTPWLRGAAAVYFKWLVAHLEGSGCVPGGREQCFGPQGSLHVWSLPKPPWLRRSTMLMQWCCLGGTRVDLSSVAMGFAFEHIDIVLNGNAIFLNLFLFFQLIHCVPTSYREQQNKNPDLFPCTVFLCTYETEFLWKKKKKATCEQVINNYIIAKTGKGQIKVAEGPLIPAFPS